MGKHGRSILIAVVLLGACSKTEVAEPRKDDLKSAAAACASGGCESFEKTSRERIVIDPAQPQETIFKCRYSFSASGQKKTEEGCFLTEEGKWRQSVCL